MGAERATYDKSYTEFIISSPACQALVSKKCGLIPPPGRSRSPADCGTPEQNSPPAAPAGPGASAPSRRLHSRSCGTGWSSASAGSAAGGRRPCTRRRWMRNSRGDNRRRKRGRSGTGTWPPPGPGPKGLAAFLHGGSLLSGAYQIHLRLSAIITKQTPRILQQKLAKFSICGIAQRNTLCHGNYDGFIHICVDREHQVLCRVKPDNDAG